MSRHVTETICELKFTDWARMMIFIMMKANIPIILWLATGQDMSGYPI
jgi:hypothetical protein